MRRFLRPRFLNCLLALVTFCRISSAQQLSLPVSSLPSFAAATDSTTPAERPWQRVALRKPMPLMLPAAVFAVGALTSRRAQLCNFDLETREQLQGMQRHTGFVRTNIDDQLRCIPAYASLSLSALGVKGRHGTLDQAVLFAMTYTLDNTIVSQLKDYTQVMRPNGSGYTSFPSQHTSMAFATATLLHKEYGGVSAWYSVGGYTIATATGAMRLLKNNHWLSDVIAGAGVGIGATELTYLLYPVLQRTARRLVPRRCSSQQPGVAATRGVVLPFYASGAAGLTLVLMH